MPGLFASDTDAKNADGLFPSRKKKSFDWGNAALGFLGVPVEQIQDRRMKRTLMQQQQITFQQKQEEQARLDAAIDSDPLLNTPELKAYAHANPKAYIDNLMQRFQPRQFAAGGGSLGLPDASGKLTFQTAPRFDDNGTIYGPGNGATAPPVLQRGTKAVPLPQGGRVGVVDSISGEEVRRPGTANTFQPGQVVKGYRFKGGDDTDPNSWEQVGGAGPQAPRTFPSPAF